MKNTKLKQLIIALSYLNNGEKLELDDDTFLSDFLDGSEKIYGWLKLNNKLYFINRDGDSLIENMNKEDIAYIFTSGIYNKILNKEYLISKC